MVIRPPCDINHDGVSSPTTWFSRLAQEQSHAADRARNRGGVVFALGAGEYTRTVKDGYNGINVASLALARGAKVRSSRTMVAATDSSRRGNGDKRRLRAH